MFAQENRREDETRSMSEILDVIKQLSIFGSIDKFSHNQGTQTSSITLRLLPKHVHKFVLTF